MLESLGIYLKQGFVLHNPVYYGIRFAIFLVIGLYISIYDDEHFAVPLAPVGILIAISFVEHVVHFSMAEVYSELIIVMLCLIFGCIFLDKIGSGDILLLIACGLFFTSVAWTLGLILTGYFGLVDALASRINEYRHPTGKKIAFAPYLITGFIAAQCILLLA